MGRQYHEGEEPFEAGADARTLYAVIQRSPEIQELLQGDVEMVDLAEVLLPEIGVEPREWPEWSDAIQEAVFMHAANEGRSE